MSDKLKCEWVPCENGIHYFYQTAFDIEGSPAIIGEVMHGLTGSYWFIKDTGGDLGFCEHLFQAKAEIEERASKALIEISKRIRAEALKKKDAFYWETARAAEKREAFSNQQDLLQAEF